MLGYVSVLTPLTSPIDRIRYEIQDHGESTIGGKELFGLYPKTGFKSGRWDSIAKIAIRERWSFAFLPDESVCFASL